MKTEPDGKRDRGAPQRSRRVQKPRAAAAGSDKDSLGAQEDSGVFRIF